MRSLARSGRGLAVALVLAAAGCTVGDGTGLLVLSISADDSVPVGAANKIVLSLPGVPDRSYPGAFPLADRAPLVLQFPNLPASSGPVTMSVRAFSASGCLVAEASKAVTVRGGAKSSAEIVLARTSSNCADAGGALDGADDGAHAGPWDAADALGGADSTNARDADGAELSDVQVPDSGADIPLNADGHIATGGAGAGGAGGGGGVATGGAPGKGGTSGFGGAPGTGGRMMGGSTGSGGTTSRGTGGVGTGGNRGTGGVTGDGGTRTGEDCVVGPFPTADPTAAGPFKTIVENPVGPTAGVAPDGGAPPQFTMFRPVDMVERGLCHPVITWGNGTGATPTMYKVLLTNLASHGFVVIASNSTNVAQGDPKPMIVGVTWVLEQNQDPASVLYHRIDTTHIGATGHSQGAMATSQASADTHIVTSVPIEGASAQRNLHGPAMFFCGGQDTTVGCDGAKSALAAVTTLPAMYAEYLSVDHGSWMSFSGATPSPVEATITAWMRVHLMGDDSLRSWFYGASCKLCTDSGWNIDRKNMDP